MMELSAELTQVWVAVAIAFFGGTACWILERLEMQTEAKHLQKIISVVLSVIFLRYVIQIYMDIQTFARY